MNETDPKPQVVILPTSHKKKLVITSKFHHAGFKYGFTEENGTRMIVVKDNGGNWRAWYRGIEHNWSPYPNSSEVMEV